MFIFRRMKKDENRRYKMSLYHGLVVRERAGRHWWVKNAGFKLVVGKINFRARKIGGSRKVNWWVRNFCFQNVTLKL
jgi:hypothetical protein